MAVLVDNHYHWVSKDLVKMQKVLGRTVQSLCISIASWRILSLMFLGLKTITILLLYNMQETFWIHDMWHCAPILWLLEWRAKRIRACAAVFTNFSSPANKKGKNSSATSGSVPAYTTASVPSVFAFPDDSEEWWLLCNINKYRNE